MRTPAVIVVLGTLCAVLSLDSRALSQDPPADMPDMQTMMKKWLAASTPGPKHKLLDPLVGQWDTITKIWMAGPSAPPTEMKGTASIKWVLDGRYLLHEADGQMLMPDDKGQMKMVPHKGMGLTGHDNYRNMYVATWADNANTTILTMSGAADPSGKVFTFYGEMDEPMLDVRGRMVRYVTRLVDEKKFVFEIIDLHAGPEYKVVEITYQRNSK